MKYILVLLSLIYTARSCAQVDIINQSLTDSSLNIFYTGVDNRIKLKVKKDLPNYTVMVKGAGSSLAKIDPDKYAVRVTAMDNCTVIVRNRKGKEVLTRKYKIGSLPDAMATVSGLRDATIKLNQLLLNPFITVVLPGCYYLHRKVVVSFLATITQNSDSAKIVNTGNQFSEELIKAARQLIKGDQIYFEDIRVLSPDDGIRKLDPFWLKIE